MGAARLRQQPQQGQLPRQKGLVERSGGRPIGSTVRRSREPGSRLMGRSMLPEEGWGVPRQMPRYSRRKESV